MKELLLCALKRRGVATTAGDLYDAAVALARDAGWPRRTWTATSVQQAASLLRGMETRKEVTRAGTSKENGREVPMWVPPAPDDPNHSRWDPHAEIPQPPPRSAQDHPLHGLTSRQMHVLFDLFEEKLHNYSRMHQESFDLMMKHNRAMCDDAARAKRELLAAGIIEDTA